MKTFRENHKLHEALDAWREAGETIALVPTMGNLHKGHMSLVARAREHASRVVVSVYVNPTQFGPSEDFAAYPRTLENDRRRLGRAQADALFAPEDQEIYPFGTSGMTRVMVPGLSDGLCGAVRPGHFDGVTSVVLRLFNIVQPQFAVFGQKDYQQLMIIRRMTADLHLPVSIIGAPTLREDDGLAMSSRNQYLGPADRQRAPALYQALDACAARLRSGRQDYAALEAEGLAQLQAAGFSPDYFAVRDADTLASPLNGTTRRFVVLTAARCGPARLIDNVLVE